MQCIPVYNVKHLSVQVNCCSVSKCIAIQYCTVHGKRIAVQCSRACNEVRYCNRYCAVKYRVQYSAVCFCHAMQCHAVQFAIGCSTYFNIVQSLCNDCLHARADLRGPFQFYCNVFIMSSLNPLHCTSLHCQACNKLHSALQCIAVQCTVPHRTEPNSAALHCTKLNTALLCTSLHCTSALNCPAPLCTPQHCTTLNSTALHCTALHCTKFHCNSLHYTSLYCNAHL